MKKIIVHRFFMGDVEDPEIYAAQPIWEWQQTPKGAWLMKNGDDLTFHIHMNPATYGYDVHITCGLEGKKLTEYYLRWE
jgi:hypothetical protein